MPGLDDTMEIRINGELRTVPAGCSVDELLKCLEIVGDRVAVEVNREIIRRAMRAGTRLSPGDEVEVVHFVGGGRG